MYYTTKKRYQIFVSSTFKDLIPERNAIIKLITGSGNIPVGMEMFPSTDKDIWTYIKKTIKQCDYYVVIVAHRYGYVPTGKNVPEGEIEGYSFTEMEYECAQKAGVPTIKLVLDKSIVEWKTDREAYAQKIKLTQLTEFIEDCCEAGVEDKLKAFTNKLGTGKSYWTDVTELVTKFNLSLQELIQENPPRPGLISGDDMFANFTSKAHAFAIQFRNKTVEIGVNASGKNSNIVNLNLSKLFWFFFKDNQTKKFNRDDFLLQLRPYLQNIHSISISYLTGTDDPIKKVLLTPYWDDKLIIHDTSHNGTTEYWYITEVGWFVWRALDVIYRNEKTLKRELSTI